MAKKKKQSKPQQANPKGGLLANAERLGNKRVSHRPLIFIGLIGGGSLLLIALYNTVPSFRHFVKDIFSAETKITLVAFPPPKTLSTKDQIQFSDFVGAEACKDCHVVQYQLWKNSTHGRAGGEPGNAQIIAKFDGKPIYFKDAVVTPSVNDKGEYLFTVEQKGKARQEIKVAAVVGGGHMFGGGTQSFFGKFPDGTLRFLPFDFAKSENLWFAKWRDPGPWIPISREMSIDELANWPPHRVLGAEPKFSNCQNCHGSQIMIQYDAAKRQYATQYQTLRINCESCHGPGRRHLELAASPGFDELPDIGMQPLSTLSKDQSLMACFQCHSLKDVIKRNYLPGKLLEEYFALKLPILGSEPYLPDGRVREFAYQENHLFSDCYLNGSMTCVDCHDPHSQKYRDVFGNPLIGRFDNGQCVGCHASKAESAAAHSRHRPNSPGNRCTSCHMPYLQHPSVGKRLKFARSDHSIPIPRPAFDATLGIENACKQCHQDKTEAWLQSKLEAWFGKIKPHHAQIANLLQAEEIKDMTSAAKLLLNTTPEHPMVQVMGLSQFIKRHLRPDMTTINPEIIDRLKGLAGSRDIDVKSLSLMALHFSADHDSKVRAWLLEETQKLGDREMAVRLRWANAVDYLGSRYAMSGDFTAAIAAHQKALEIIPDDPITLMNLGIAYQGQRDFESAIAVLKQARRINPHEAFAYFQLAQAHLSLRQIPEAIAALRDGLLYEPDNQPALALLRQLESL